MKLRPKLLILTAERALPGLAKRSAKFCKRAAGSVNPGVPGFAGPSHAAQGAGSGPICCPRTQNPSSKKEPRPPAWLMCAQLVARHIKFNFACKGEAPSPPKRIQNVPCSAAWRGQRLRHDPRLPCGIETLPNRMIHRLGRRPPAATVLRSCWHSRL